MGAEAETKQGGTVDGHLEPYVGKAEDGDETEDHWRHGHIVGQASDERSRETMGQGADVEVEGKQGMPIQVAVVPCKIRVVKNNGEQLQTGVPKTNRKCDNGQEAAQTVSFRGVFPSSSRPTKKARLKRKNVAYNNNNGDIA